MARASFLWDDENVAHIAEHGLIPEEVEPVVNNANNDVRISRSSGRPTTFGMTKTSKYIAVAWVEVAKRPLTKRVITAYEVPRPSRR